MKKEKTQMWKMWNQDCEVRVKNEHLLAIPVIDRMITGRVGVFSFVLLSSGVRANAELAYYLEVRTHFPIFGGARLLL